MITLPECLPSWALLFMAIFLYGKKICWKDIKGSWRNVLKAIIALVLAVIINQLFRSLNQSDIDKTAKDMLEIALVIPVGIIWYKAYKKDKQGDKDGEGDKVKSADEACFNHDSKRGIDVCFFCQNEYRSMSLERNLKDLFQAASMNINLPDSFWNRFCCDALRRKLKANYRDLANESFEEMIKRVSNNIAKG